MTPPLVVIGNVNVDLMMGPQAPWPAPGTESILARSELRVGGAAGNTALAWQGLGAAFHIVANTSADPLGCWLRKPFGAAGAAWPASTRPCGVSVGLTHPDGERTFFTTLGHLEDFGIGDVLAQLPPATDHGGLALLTGSFVTPRLLPDYENLMAALQAAGYAIALDTGWPNEGWSAAVRSRVTSWLPSCTHLLLNEAEALGLTDVPSVDEAMSLLGDRLAGSATLVIKAGANGAYARAGSEATRVPAPIVSVIDTIGAGDTFNAGYLLALQQGGSWRDAVNQGVTTATQAVATSPRQYHSIDLPITAGLLPDVRPLPSSCGAHS